MAGPSSRKRSYAEVARSESPLEDSPPRSKRRRISTASTTSNTLLPRERPSPHAGPLRYEGDGFDFRRPIMSSTHEPEQIFTTIDLTADDDDTLPTTPSNTQLQRRTVPTDSRSLREARAATSLQRAPPFGRNHISIGPEVIDLVTDSDGIEAGVNNNGRVFTSHSDRSRGPGEGSPDLVFVSERTLIPGPQNVDAARAARRLPTPPAMRVEGGLQSLSIFLERSRNLIWNSITRDGQGGHDHNDLLDRIDGLRDRERPGAPANNSASEPLLLPPDYPEVALDYQHPGFDIGYAGVMGSEADRSSTPPQIIEQEPYKKPPPAGHGFSRNLKEDDVVVCPCCGDELALGEGDIKQQIWIAKQCGHLYCGACATARIIDKRPNKRQQKAAVQRKVIKELKTCIADGCKSRLGITSAMFQIYL